MNILKTKSKRKKSDNPQIDPLIVKTCGDMSRVK